MAKMPIKRTRRSPSAIAEFKTSVPQLIRDSWLAMATRFASLLEADRAGQIEDIVAAHLAKNGLPELPNAVDQPFLGYLKFSQVVSTYVSRVTNLLSGKFEEFLQMRQAADPSVFNMRIGSEALSLVFGPSTIPGGENAFAAKEPFAPLIRAFREAKIDLNLPSKMENLFIGADVDDKERPIYERSVDISGKSMLGYQPSDRSRELLKTGIIQVKLDCSVVVTDSAITITPYIDIEIDRTVYDNVVEYEGSNQEPLYIYMWMKQAVEAASSNTGAKRWKGTPVVDLRIVTKKLRATKSTFGAVKARVNKDGFAIGGTGMPLFVPEVDNCAAYVTDISKSTKIVKGQYDFASSHLQWANRVVLVDWFNDYILYADPLGELQFQRLLGVRALDSATEMMFLNTPIDLTQTMVQMVAAAVKLAAENVSESEAEAHLTPDEKSYFDAQGGTPNIFTAMNRVELGNVSREMERSSFKHKSTVALKHLLGLDIDEMRDVRTTAQLAANASVVRAYFRVLYRKRGKLDLPVFQRLNGLEYIMFAAEKYSAPEKWQQAKADHNKQQDGQNSNFTFGDTIEMPNLEISDKTISAVMPHQVKYLGAMRDGVQSGAAWIATGGGKGLMAPLDIIQQMALGKVKRPLIATKPRLVKENISEINRISGGKINVVPLRTRNIRHLKRKAGLKTAQDFLNWARALPANTIFICAYSDFATRATLFPELDVPGRALWYNTQLSQLVHLIRLIGIDMVYGDESHLVKNMDSARSICAYSVFAGADQTRIASGTGNANTPKDYVGQYFSLNPTIFGSNVDQFEKTYAMKGGLIVTDDAAQRMNFRMKELSRTFNADEEDWSFVLPVFKDQIEYYTLTPLQEEFYDILLQRAQLEMKAKLEESKKRKPVSDRTDGDEEDDEDEDEEDFEDEDAKMIAFASTGLAKVEQFIIAPDANEEYTSWVKAPRGEDLVSPAVRKLDADLDKHFGALPKDRWSQEKVLVFGINKVASVHLYKHSRYAKQGLRYEAADEEVVRKFKAEPQQLVLFADETSLREGENLQMCSMVCRMQPVWTPGDYKQAAARAYRPDPRGVFADRESVRHVWYIAEGQRGRPTISSVKLSTMIAKSVANARLRYEDDPAWRRISPEFEDLKRLRMNLELIFNTQHEDIDPYMKKWTMFNKWVGDRVQTAKLKAAEELEKEHNIDLIKNGKILDIKLFLKLAMRPLTSKTMLPGSRRVYTPWEFGAIPADVYKLDLVVLGGQPAPPGTPVMTEFGAAKVVSDDSDRSIKVELYGGKNISLRRLAVAIPGSDIGKKRLAAIVKSKLDWKKTYTSPRIVASATAKDVGERVATGDVPTKTGLPLKTKVPVVKPVEEDDDEDRVEVFTQILNGWPFLAIDASQDVPKSLSKMGDWRLVAPYMAVTFQSWAQADKFLDILADKFFITQPKFDKLAAELETLRAGRAMRLITRVKDNEVRSFFQAQHKMKGKANNGRFVIDPYWVAFEDIIYLAFDRASHSTSVLNWLRRAVSQVKGMKLAKPNEGFWVHGFKNLKEAEQAITNAAQLLNFDADAVRDEIQELKEDLKQFAAKKVTPRALKRR